MKMFRKDEGFTLIELMVVVLIIGILVAIAIPVFGAARRNAQQNACFGNERTVDGAARTYQAENTTINLGAGFNATLAALVPDYLKQLPTCPAGGAYTWTDANGDGQGGLECATHGYYGGGT